MSDHPLNGPALLQRFHALDSFLMEHQALWRPRPFTHHPALPWEASHPELAAWLGARSLEQAEAAHNQPQLLAANLRRAFSGIVAGNVKAHGIQLIEEQVVEMTYDEEFNPIEVRKTNKVPVAGYSLLFSVNEKGNKLISALFAKGIVTKQGKYYHFLFSPPLSLNILPKSISAYTAGKPPKVTTGASNNGLWNYRGTDVLFHIDSLKKKEIHGSLEFEVASFLKRGKTKR